MSRAKFMGQLWDQTSPAVFLAWAERMRITVPDELIAEVKALGVQIADWKSLYEKERLRAGKLDEELESERSAHLATKREHVAYLKKVGDDQRHTHAEYDKAMQAGRDLLTLRDDRIAQLEKLVEELQSGPPIADKASETAARPLSTRERDSLLKLVIGMAMKGYAYDPKAGRSPTAKEIASDLALIGLPLDEDTVRKYLGEARQVLPSDEAEKNR